MAVGLKDGMNFSYSSDDDRTAIGVQAVNRGNFANIGGATSLRLADTLNPQASDPTPEFRFRPSNPSWGRLRSFGNSCNHRTGHCRERVFPSSSSGVTKVSQLLKEASPIRED
jgi:hypothetical protein